MTVTTTYPNLVPLASYPGTEAAWRDTRGRELVPATVQTQSNAREALVGSDKDRYRNQEGRSGSVATLASDTTITLTEEAIQRQSEDASSQEQQSREPPAGEQNRDAQARADQPDNSSARATGETTSDKQHDAATDASAPKDSAGKPLTEEEKKAVADLNTRDEEVRQHERDHQVTGGRYAQAPTFELSLGPDGKRYATGGEVRIDLSKESTPQATIQKMQQIERAALAPQEPSTQDRRVASRAAQIADEARADELRQQQTPSVAQQRLREQAPAAETLIRSINDPRQDDQSPVMALRNQAISRRYAQSWQAAQSATISRYA